MELENVIFGAEAYIYIKHKAEGAFRFYKSIECYNCYGQLVSSGECLLFPSKDQRDWTKFKVKKEKFDPYTLKPFDRVLVRYTEMERWRADFLSFVYKPIDEEMCHTIGSGPVHIAIPYNDDTKYLVGTTDDCPDYYKWWEE